MPQLSRYSHISIQPAAEEGAQIDSKQGEEFIRIDSVQQEIDDDLLHPSQSSYAAAVSAQPRTFAEAAMSTRRSRQNTYDDNSDPTLAKSMTLESLGPFKYSFKKKKKTSKWAPFDLGAADSASEGGSIGTGELGPFTRLPSPVPMTSTLISSTTTVPFTHISSSTPNPLQDPAASFPTLQEVYSATAASAQILLARDRITQTPTVADLSEAREATDATPVADPSVLLSALDPSDLGGKDLDQHCPPSQLHCNISDTQSTENQSTEHQSTEHQSTEHQSTEHQSTEHQSTEHQSTEHQSTEHQSTEHQADEAMASLTVPVIPGQDKENNSTLFDYVEWDPDLPSASAQHQSPEPVATPAQPVTYTTVGSIVNLTATPKFTAPNRIQREGSGRRPLLPLIQTLQHDSLYLHRGHSPLNTAGGLQHAHLPIQSQNRFNPSHTPPPNVTRSVRSAHSLQHIGSLREHEKSVLANVQDSTAPHIFSGNLQGSGTAPPKYSMLSNITQPSFGVGDSMEEENLGCFTSVQCSGPVQGPVQGLEKMQTLQRLAKFENPMQSLALSRLSEFSVSRSHSVARTFDNPSLAVEELLRLKGESSDVTSTKGEANAQKPGELNRAYRFPLPSTVDPSKPQANPLFGAFSPSTMKSSKDPACHQPGYPAPLTAGPPGQRQFQGTANKAHGSYPDNSWGPDPQSSVSNPYGGASAQAKKLWTGAPNTEHAEHYTYQSAVPSSRSKGGWSSVILDTATVPVVSKYYPRGLPADMTGNIVPLSHATQKKMGMIPDDAEPQTAEEKSARKAKGIDDWFYGGQRRFAGMSATDHIREYEERRLGSVNPFGPIGSGSTKPLLPAQHAPLSVEDINKMSVAEATAPLLDAVFGSMLTYATRTNGPDDPRVLSKYEISPDWLLDTSENGSKSFYGEDWGPPPKKIGGGARHE